jgi:hypothetical protein
MKAMWQYAYYALAGLGLIGVLAVSRPMGVSALTGPSYSLDGRPMSLERCVAPSPSGDPPTIHSSYSSYGPPMPPAHYRVDSKLLRLYCGQYVLKTAARSARLSGGTLQIAVNAAGYLYGVGEFYGYDAQGYQSNQVAALWNFHLTAPGVMSINLLSLMTWVPQGRLVVRRSNGGDLSGRLALGTHSYTISWHKLADLPATTGRSFGGLQAWL